MKRMLFDIEGEKAVAEMFEDVVPKTCAAIWNILPVEGMSIHANWASREIMLHLAGDKILRLKPEGPRRQGGTAPGDISYFWRSPQMSRGQQKAYAAQFQRELSEFAIFYGEPSGGGVAASDPARSGRDLGLSVSMTFAHFVDLPMGFVKKCDGIRHEGLKKLVVTRLED